MNTTILEYIGEPEQLGRAYTLALAAKCYNPARLAKALVIANDDSTAKSPIGGIKVKPSLNSDTVLVAYHASAAGCQCVDYQRHTHWCKHRIAWALVQKAHELWEAELAAATATMELECQAEQANEEVLAGGSGYDQDDEREREAMKYDTAFSAAQPVYQRPILDTKLQRAYDALWGD